MKKYIYITVMLLMVFATKVNAQEKHGKTLNMGVGLSYYGYVGYNTPVLHLDYEFDVLRDFTLAPSISYFTFHNNYYWGNHNYPYRYYNYRQTIIPIGVKGTYYFDKIVKAGSKWDFYIAGTLGVAIIKSTWDDGYYGDRVFYNKTYYRGSTPLFLDLHLGTEYHLSDRVGLFLDLSTGVSTVGLAVHF